MNRARMSMDDPALHSSFECYDSQPQVDRLQFTLTMIKKGMYHKAERELEGYKSRWRGRM